MSHGLLNPTIKGFAPISSQQHNMVGQVSPPPSPYLEARILNLEEEHVSLLGEVKNLKESLHDLSSSVNMLKKGGWPVHVGPFQEQDIKRSHQNAMEFSMELEKLKDEVQKSVNGNADVQKVNGMAPSKPDGSTILSPPASPKTIIQDLPSVEALSLEAWEPHHLTTLPAFPKHIPASEDLTTFHHDFLCQTLGGGIWSPGLRFVSGKGPCMLKNRTYYQIDPKNEPFLPKAPGEHGAKLTAFFNAAPEEKFASLLPEDSNSYENVPMFVLVGKRYMYFGNYSQTRWSDKLDYDTMTARVPQHVKNFWADELTAPTREAWVTDALKKHFFPKPEYTGRIYAELENASIIDAEKEIVLNDKMAKDVRRYVEELREWEREANMKTAMIKKQFILDAFEAVSRLQYCVRRIVC
jgi:hypothetical protein